MTLGHKLLSEIVADAGAIIQDTSTSRATFLKSAINRRYREAVTSDRWPSSLRTDETGLRNYGITDLFTFVAGEKEAPMPQGCARVENIQLQNVSTPPLEWREQGDFYNSVGSQIDVTGIPVMYTDIGTTAQYRRLSAAGVVTCFSNVVANDNQRSVRVWFKSAADVVSGDAWTDVSGAFSTGVSLTQAVAEGYPISRVELPAGWVGSFSIQDGSAVAIANIQSLEFPKENVNSTRQTMERRLIRVWPAPTSDYAATISWWREVPDLTEDQDSPIIPIAEYLVHGAAADGFRQMGRLDEAGRQDSLAMRALRQAEKQSGQTRTTFSIPRRGNVASMTGLWGWRLR